MTDSGRARPVGYSKKIDSPYQKSSTLGSGYVSLIENQLTAKFPQLNINLLNLGINGNRITDLSNRWQRDVITHSPDWVIIQIGINDVWRHFDRPLEPNQVSINEFENIYRHLIKLSLKENIKITLMTPYFLEKDPLSKMRCQILEYANAVKNLANEYHCVLVELQPSFDHFLKYRSYTDISNDKIHLNKTGHMLIAESFLSAMNVT